MAQDRERACIYYKFEGNCSKGHKGTFRKVCQKCKDYYPAKRGKAARKDLRQEKREKYTADRRNWEN